MLVHPQSELIREPRLLVPGQQPVGPVKIDRTHPVGRRVVVCALATPQGPVDIASGRPFVKVGGTPKMTPASKGVLADTNGANYSWELPLLDTNIGKELLVFWYGERLGTPTDGGGVFVLTYSNNSGSAPYVAAALKYGDTSGTSLSYQYNNGGTNVSQARTIPSLLGKPSSLALWLTAKYISAVGYVNGSRISPDVGAFSSVIFGTGPRIVIGEDYGDSRNGASGTYLCVVLKDAQDGEALAMHIDPYQFLIPA